MAVSIDRNRCVGLRRARAIAAVSFAALAFSAVVGLSAEADPRPALGRLIHYPVSRAGATGLDGVQSVVGTIHLHSARAGETFLDIARDYGLGYNELVLANPHVDPWVLTAGEPILIPSQWVLPAGRHNGLVLNIPEMRVYYYPPGRASSPDSVVTFAVGLGRQDWQTPRGSFRVSGKTVNPTWVIPESIRRERIEEDGLTDTFIPGGDPENPLGKYRLELTLPSYAIHSTNKTWGIGMQVSHGCVRMYPDDMEAFFPLVKVGTPGSFVYQTVKVGVVDKRVMIEVHDDIYGVSAPAAQLAASLLAKKGLTPYVDQELLEAALDASSGIPTDIGKVSLSDDGL